MLKRISLFFILFNFIVCPFTLQSEDIMDIFAAYDGVYTAVSLSGILLFPIADFGEFYDFGTGSGL